MELGTITAVITALATLMGGMWAMFQKITSSFLTHLEKKNGHTERIAKEFSETVGDMQDCINENNIQLAKMNENYRNITSVLDTATRAVQDHHRHPP